MRATVITAALAALPACAAVPLLALDGVLQLGDCIHSASGNMHACLRPGGAIEVGRGPDAQKPEEVVYSGGIQRGKKNGKFMARMKDGAFVILQEGKKGAEQQVWSTNTAGGNYIYLDDAGALTVYQAGFLWDSALWSSSPSIHLSAGAAGTSTDAVVEPATGISLRATDTFGGSAPLRCVGAGVRAKSLAVVSVNVYALGLYVEPRAAAKALAKYASVAPAERAKDAGFYEELMKPTAAYPRYLLLSFARDVSAAKVTDALTAVQGVAPEVLKAFADLLGGAIGGAVHAGDTIALGWEGKDRLVVVVRGKKAGEVKDAALPGAIFKLYLGSDPVSPPAKAAFASGVSAIF